MILVATTECQTKSENKQKVYETQEIRKQNKTKKKKNPLKLDLRVSEKSVNSFRLDFLTEEPTTRKN